MSVDLDDPVACCNLGNALVEQGKADEAVAYFRKALSLRPELAELHNNLGCAQIDLGGFSAAATSLRQALALKPDYPEAHNNLGLALENLDDAPRALASYRQALQLKTGYAAAAYNLARLLWKLGALDQADRFYRQALKSDARHVDALEGLGRALQHKGETEESLALHDRAVGLRQDSLTRIKRALVMPPIYSSTAELRHWRDTLTDNIKGLRDEGVRVDLTNEKASFPFYLAYQGDVDRDLLESLSALYCAPAEPSAQCSDPSDRRIHVGFVSAHFKQHTVGELMRGVIANLSKDEFDVTALSFGKHDDDVAQFIRDTASRFIVLPRELPDVRRLIADLNLDVLLYTDIGMEPLTYSLAFSRLAPVQCVTWGHPSTTGIDTVDYFISSELFETRDAQQHYTERLVCLENIPACFYRPAGPTGNARGKEYFDIPADCHLYSCPQSLFKLHPEFDGLLAGILRRDPHGIVVLNEPHNSYFMPWKHMLQSRFEQAIPDVAKRVRFLPRLRHEDYLSLVMASDVQLDPIYFNGGNTSVKALALGAPVVTLPMQAMKSRMTLGMYKKLDVLDCVAEDSDDYIEKAVRIGCDSELQSVVRTKIRDAAEALFDNTETVRELECFFREAVARTR